MEQHPTTLTIDRLVVDKANVRRKRDGDSVNAMKASIIAHGLIQNLRVRPPAADDADLGGDRYRVSAGSRRLRAIAELIEEKKLPADWPIPVTVRDDDDDIATEVSLAENIIRQDMHPVDTYRTFAGLAQRGHSAKDIALRFGQSERFVRQVMALGRVHPDILAAFEADEIGLGAVEAYTINPDTEAQIAYFNAAEPEYMRSHAHYIREAMVGKGIRADSRLTDFIGEDRYRASGGLVVEDLFQDNSLWTSHDVIEKLRAERVAEIKDDALKDGWSFAETIEEHGRQPWELRTVAGTQTDLSEEDTARMDELTALLEADAFEGEEEFEAAEAELTALESRTSIHGNEDKAKLGVVVDPQSGRIWLGVSKDDARSSGTSGSAEREKPAKDPLESTKPMKEIVGDVATKTLREAIAAQPDLALAFLAASLEGAVAQVPSGRGDPHRLTLTVVEYGAGRSKEPRQFKTAFAAYRKMKPAEIKKAIAGLVAETADLTERWFDRSYSADDKRDETRSQMIEAFGIDAVEAFDPAAWFEKANRAMIDAAMVEMTGHSASGKKKADAAKEATAEAEAAGWLPEALRSKSYKLKEETARNAA